MPFKVDFFRHRLLGRLIRSKPVEVHTRGQAVRSGGEVGLIFVEKGHVRLLGRAGKSMRERVVQVAGPGEMEGVEALTGKGDRLRPAVAGEPTTIRRIEATALRGILRRSRTTLDDLLEALTTERSFFEGLVGAGPESRAPHRVARVLLTLEQRFSGGESAGIPFRLTHGVLADLAGVHRSTATTLVNDWLYRGLLAEEGDGWRVLNPDSLQDEVSR